MNPCQANSREYQWQAINAEVKSVEESIRALIIRRNALVPVSSLPPEVISSMFSFLRLGATAPTLRKNRLAWLHVAHVYHRWREIALNQPLFWSHVDFIALTSAGAAEILTRAKKVPLHLEAKVTGSQWDCAQFSAFEKELQPRVSHICHLSISVETFHLRRILGGLASPAPTLERLSLTNEKHRSSPELVFIPDNIFNNATPRLSCLELCNCNVNWTSPLLKGLKKLQIIRLSVDFRPSLAIWLDALDEMPQLKTLTLDVATPRASRAPYEVERSVTLPFLTNLKISASARNCGLALAHLNVPALTCLYVAAKSHRKDGGDVQNVLPHLTRYARGPHDTEPLQSILVRGNRTCADVFAWTVPDIDGSVHNSVTLSAAMSHVRVALSVTSKIWSFPETYTGVLHMAMATLPLDSLVTLTALNLTRFDEPVWRRHAPRWPLLQRVRLGPPAAHGFREMLLNDNGGRECPLLPSLTKLVLVNTGLSKRRTLRICDALMQRVEQGVPLESLDLRTCIGTIDAIRLLREIVVDVSDVWKPRFTKRPTYVEASSVPRDYFVHDYNFEEVDYGDSDDEDEDGFPYGSRVYPGDYDDDDDDEDLEGHLEVEEDWTGLWNEGSDEDRYNDNDDLEGHSEVEEDWPGLRYGGIDEDRYDVGRTL